MDIDMMNIDITEMNLTKTISSVLLALSAVLIVGRHVAYALHRDEIDYEHAWEDRRNQDRAGLIFGMIFFAMLTAPAAPIAWPIIILFYLSLLNLTNPLRPMRDPPFIISCYQIFVRLATIAILWGWTDQLLGWYGTPLRWIALLCWLPLMLLISGVQAVVAANEVGQRTPLRLMDASTQVVAALGGMFALSFGWS